MSFNRIYVGAQVDNRLRLLKGRTGLTPNLLCRLGLCLSLGEPGTPDPQLYDDGQVREFNRYTLTGQWDSLFLSLLRERLIEDGIEPDVDLEDHFRAHISRGVILLTQRVKSLSDLVSLVGEQQTQFPESQLGTEM